MLHAATTSTEPLAATQLAPARASRHPSADQRAESTSRLRRLSSPGRFSISGKVFVLLVFQSLLVVVAFAVLVGWAFNEGFSQWTNANSFERAQRLARDLEAQYAIDGGWEAMVQQPRRWAQLTMIVAGHSVGDLDKLEAMYAQFKVSEFPDSIPAPLPLRFVLFDAEGHKLIGNPPANAEFRRWDLMHEGAVVGQLGVATNRPTSYDQQFRQRFLTVLVVTIVGSVLLSMLPALLIARFVTRPVRAISSAARSLASGSSVQPLPVKSNDELGELASDFNTLSETLQSNQEQQRQWLVDISHELRTPVAILMAESEAVMDGLRAPSLAGFKSLHDESRRLSGLIDDLHHLSLLEGGMTKLRSTEINVAELLESCVAAEGTRFSQSRLNIMMTTAHLHDMRLLGDLDQLRRVFLNLLENSLRYTDAGGELRISAERLGGRIHIVFEDSSPGVDELEIPLLFERLYRGESSRNRASGGAGLGLAIVKSIVLAHAGTIVASSSPLGGLRFDIEFQGMG